MKQILARSLTLLSGETAAMQLLTVDEDGVVLSREPFRGETAATRYISEPLALEAGNRIAALSDYPAALAELEALGAFHQLGAGAYKPGLDRIALLDRELGSPSRKIRTMHVAGTNGKGSTASTIAAVLTAAGYKTGLYTSPHLVDFRERIRIDGKEISRQAIVQFVSKLRKLKSKLSPSYFEAATALAFDWFAANKVDVAVIEVGLGGRLDSTNIITPELSVITNISLEHTAILGSTESAIAVEKGGIVKPGVPVVVGRADGAVRAVFEQIARLRHAPIVFAQDRPQFTAVEEVQAAEGAMPRLRYIGTPWGTVEAALTGRCQIENAATVFNSLIMLSERFDISAEAVRRGFADVIELSGLQGRWMHIERDGCRYICDTGHNADAWRLLGPQLADLHLGRSLKMVVGFLADKDLPEIVRYMPADADYYFVAPPSDRARSAADTAAIFAARGIAGTVCTTPEAGIAAATAAARTVPDALVFVGGSTFTASALLSR